ncbi:polyhydroxyalkanoic acid system family protein [Sphingomonas sp. PB4P5]|uniref:polyhydroxyalkanoic acid system family protein n=1 Tax=Parasphingomonas puruogangriensis TaxID=3096155 RepID=UPI002FC6A7D7
MADLHFDIPHDLGKTEARHRIEAGLPKLAAHIPGGGTVEPAWQSEDRLTLAIKAMGQKIAADLEIGETVVSGTVKIPMVLSMMAGPIGAFVKTSAEKMLAKPAG